MLDFPFLKGKTTFFRKRNTKRHFRYHKCASSSVASCGGLYMRKSAYKPELKKMNRGNET